MILVKLEQSQVPVTYADDWNSRPRPRRARAPRPAIEPATIFQPQDPSLSPAEHFPLQSNTAVGAFPRFINRFDSREILLVVDGSCVNNGRHVDENAAPVAGCAFQFKSNGTLVTPADAISSLPYVGSNAGTAGTVAFRLERMGPTGQEFEPTSNRAKLRAVIAALQFRAWYGEGWRRVVILTDLEYVVDGATQYLPSWARRQWRKPGRKGKYANRDLWREFMRVMELLRAHGCDVAFWLVRPFDEMGTKFLAETKLAARNAARERVGVIHEEFTKLCGILL